MQKIIQYLWFDTQAKEAADFYTSTFENSKIKSSYVIKNTPSGDSDTLLIELEGLEFGMISAGPHFKFNPSISYLVACKSKDEVDRLWSKLSEGGKSLMELGEYPFSAWYGWTEDKYGLSWQIMLFPEEAEIKQKITPTMMFVGEVAGKAEEAMNFYVSIFEDSEVGEISRYPEGSEPDKPGMVMHASFKLAGQYFAAMDSAQEHEFKFTEAISFMVRCKDQDEIDYYWEKLSAVPEAEQCGWLKDKYGVSWQITPIEMDEILASGDEEKIARVTEAFLKMKKFDLEEIRKAAEGQ